MSKVFNYYPPEYTSCLDSGLRRDDMVTVLNGLDDPNLLENIWHIVSAFLLNPLQNQELQTLKGPGAISALDKEVAFVDTMTTKMVNDYIVKYRTYGELAQFTLADLGRRVSGVYRLHITDLARLNEYQAAFPHVRHLILKGDQLPEGQVISAKGLEELDLYKLKEIPRADFIPAVQRLYICSFNDRALLLSKIVIQIALKHIAKLSVSTHLKTEITGILTKTPDECYEKFWKLRVFPFFEEWELNSDLQCYVYFDFDQITHLSDSMYAPCSKIRNLFLRTFLFQIPIPIQEIVSEYLEDHHSLDYRFIAKHQGNQDALEAMRKSIRRGINILLVFDEDIFGLKLRFEEFRVQAMRRDFSKDSVAES